MSTAFNAAEGLILIPARIWGPTETFLARLALDTGATSTLISATVLQFVGYDPAVAPERVRVTTGSGVEYAARLSIERIDALGQQRSGVEVLCHTLPPSAMVDGLLGLDFLRGQRLTLDFRAGRLSLE